MTEYEDLRVSSPGGGVVLVTLDRPAARNALRTATLAAIADVLQAAADDADVGCVVLTGAGDCFAADSDLKEMAALGPVELMADSRPRYWKRIAAFPKPLLAAVNGDALGAGCELVMHVDIAIAADGAHLGQPEINLGTIPGAGGTQRLVRIAGKSRAMQMILCGEPIDAATARECGLVSEVLPAPQVLPRALALARSIAAKAPLAVRAAKEAALMAYETGLAQAVDAERKAYLLLAGTHDRNEGIAAYLEKRAPRFEGR